jgi:hypothetical protein
MGDLEDWKKWKPILMIICAKHSTPPKPSTPRLCDGAGEKFEKMLHL